MLLEFFQRKKKKKEKEKGETSWYDILMPTWSSDNEFSFRHSVAVLESPGLHSTAMSLPHVYHLVDFTPSIVHSTEQH